MIGGNYWYAGLSVQRKVVQSSGLYCATRLLIRGNYWYAGLLVRGEYLSKGPVRAKNPQTVLFRQTLQQAVLYQWSTSEVWHQSAGLLDSSVQYSSYANYRPNEALLGDFNFKIKHENVYITFNTPQEY